MRFRDKPAGYYDNGRLHEAVKINRQQIAAVRENGNLPPAEGFLIDLIEETTEALAFMLAHPEVAI